jgi:hypothetical protein
MGGVMRGENELIQYPMDIGPLLNSLPRKKRQPGDLKAGIKMWQDRIDQMVFDCMTGRAPPPKNEDR